MNLNEAPQWNTTDTLTETIIRESLAKGIPLYVATDHHAMVLDAIYGFSANWENVIIDVLNTNNNGSIGHWSFTQSMFAGWSALDSVPSSPRMRDSLIDIDSDGDGEEDYNRNGLLDSGEKDPLDSSDDSQSSPEAVSLFTDYALYGFERVKVNDGVSCGSSAVDCPVGAAGSLAFTNAVEIGVQAQVGSIVSGSGAYLRNKASVIGDVLATDSLTSQEGTFIGGSLSENATIGASVLPNYLSLPTLSLTGSESDIKVHYAETRALAPGEYGSISINDGGHLILTAGTYEFHDLKYAWTGEIELDSTTGPVRVRVENEFIWHGPRVQ
ncbi:MAG TPA: hypothetical protein VLM37_09260, partial [Fibrobacteraceae bacterium]|nr:hypothetical protein [Fibrobacteraceae bacterium]